MVMQHYRWDFIGLSTDTKPTPQNSEKVVDGSTYYCSDTSKLYVYCKDNWYEKVVEGGGGGTTYTAGDGIDITNAVISATNTGKAKVLTSADYNYHSSGNTDDGVAVWKLDAGVYEVNGTDASPVKIYYASNGADDDTYTMPFTFIVTHRGGMTRCIRPTSDMSFPLQITACNESNGTQLPNLYSNLMDKSIIDQSTGTSTGKVMSQNAVTSMVFADPSAKTQIRIGADTTVLGINTVAIGNTSYARTNGLALGAAAKANDYGIAFTGGETTAMGVMQVGPNKAGWDTSGYNQSAYRLISGVYDGQSNHDAATVAQGNKLMTTAPTTTDAGVLGQLWTDTTAMHTYQCTAIDTTDPDNPLYTWTQRW